MQPGRQFTTILYFLALSTIAGALLGCASTHEPPPGGSEVTAVTEPTDQDDGDTGSEVLDQLNQQVRALQEQATAREERLDATEADAAAERREREALEAELDLVREELAQALSREAELGDAFQATSQRASQLAEENARLLEIIEDLQLLKALTVGSAANPEEPIRTAPSRAIKPAGDTLSRPAIPQPFAPGLRIATEPRLPALETAPRAAAPPETGTEPQSQADDAAEPPSPPAVAPPPATDYRPLSRIGPVQETTRRSAVALSELFTDTQNGTERLYDARVDYTATATYLTAELTQPPRLLLVAQLVRTGRPQFVSGATLIVTTGTEEVRVPLDGTVERESAGQMLREAIVVVGEPQMLPAFAAVAGAQDVRVEFGGITETYVHRLTKNEQAAMANLLVAFIDLGGVVR